MADFFNQVGQEVHVVHARKYLPEHLVRAEEVVYVRAGVFGTNGTSAVCIERREVVLIFVIWNLVLAVGGINAAVAAVAGREHAVERVDAGLYADKHIFRLADAEQMPRFILRQLRIYFIQNTEDVLLAERAADAVAVKVHVRQIFSALDAQVGISPALHDAVYRLL